MLCSSIALLLMVILSSQSSLAEEANDGFWSIQLENDMFGSNNDQYYTHGTKISFVTAEPMSDSLQYLADRLPFYRQSEDRIQGFEIGQAIFTPSDIKIKELIENDRPYAGWLYFNIGSGHRYEDRGDRERMNFLLLTTGIVGPASLAEDTQKSIHELTGSDTPRGWSNQLQNELGFNVSFLHKTRRIHDFDERLQSETGFHHAVVLGNVYSFAAAGVMARYGTHLKTDIGPPSILPGFSGIPAFDPHRKSNWYLFAGIEARIMARNIFLDGNTFRDSHSVNKETLVGDLQFGLAYHFRDMRISFVQLYRTREFEEQSRPTRYGAINITFFGD